MDSNDISRGARPTEVLNLRLDRNSYLRSDGQIPYTANGRFIT